MFVYVFLFAVTLCMPAAGDPVITPVVIAAAAGGLGVATGAVTITSAAISVGVAAASAGAQYLLSRGGASPASASFATSGNAAAPSAAPVNGARNIPTRQAVPPRRFVYGRARIGGAVFFQDNNNPKLVIGTALSDGVIDAVEGVFFGDTQIVLDGSGNAVSGTIYTGKFSLETATGLDSQAASSAILSRFPTLPSTFRQQGVARAVATLDWGTDAQNNATLWGNSVSPAYLMRGVKVYDPRVVGASPTDKTTWVYRANMALCVGHALTNAWGVALDQSHVDWASFSAGADACDALVTYGGVQVPTFVGAGVFQSGADLAPQLAQMLSAFDGAILYSDGLYKLYVDGPRTSVWTVTDDDIYGLSEFPFDNDARDRFGAIKATYFDASGGGNSETTTVYELTPGGRETALPLPFTSEKHSAQILAYRALVRSQKNQTFTLTVSDAGLWLDPFDVITIASSGMAFLNGAYVVAHVEPAPEGATLLLRPYDATVYADPTGYLV